jgi:hypothetical protein
MIQKPACFFRGGQEEDRQKDEGEVLPQMEPDERTAAEELARWSLGIGGVIPDRAFGAVEAGPGENETGEERRQQ